jgi:hypothetical protein
MNSGNRAGLSTTGLLLSLSVLALTLAAQQSTSLVVHGQPGDAKVVQVQGHNYVEIDGLARITNGSISFKDSQIVLTLPGTQAASAAPQSTPGFSRDFLTAGIEAMARVREWHSALKTAIERGVPLGTGWLDAYQEQAQQALNLAMVAINTDADKSAYPVLVGINNNMKALTDKYVQQTKAMIYLDPNSLQSDPLDQRLVACGHSLSAMASSRQFIDDSSCQ